MKYIPTFLISCLFVLTASTVGQAQRFGPGQKGEKVKTLWVAFVTQKLELNTDEAAKFWPIYEKFQKEHRQLHKSKHQLIKQDVTSYTEAEIDALIQQITEIETKETALKQQYYIKLKTAIPAQKVFILPKIEREFKRQILKALQKRGKGKGRPARDQGPPPERF